MQYELNKVVEINEFKTNIDYDFNFPYSLTQFFQPFQRMTLINSINMQLDKNFPTGNPATLPHPMVIFPKYQVVPNLPVIT